MASKKKRNQKIYVIGAVVLLIVILAINFGLTQKKKEIPNQQEQTKEERANLENENIIAKLQDMEERDRIEYYFGMFLREMEEEEYEKAYQLLYEDFKKNYFPTLDSFTQYAQKTFPEMPVIEYENIERNGDVYILWITIDDALKGGPNTEKQKMNVVVRENDYNDFEMSFSVI